jgi:hypothetical protein
MDGSGFGRRFRWPIFALRSQLNDLAHPSSSMIGQGRRKCPVDRNLGYVQRQRHAIPALGVKRLFRAQTTVFASGARGRRFDPCRAYPYVHQEIPLKQEFQTPLQTSCLPACRRQRTQLTMKPSSKRPTAPSKSSPKGIGGFSPLDAKRLSGFARGFCRWRLKWGGSEKLISVQIQIDPRRRSSMVPIFLRDSALGIC